MGQPTLVDLKKKIPPGGLLNPGLRKMGGFNVGLLHRQFTKSVKGSKVGQASGLKRHVGR